MRRTRNTSANAAFTAADQVLTRSTLVASSRRCASSTRFVRFMRKIIQRHRILATRRIYAIASHLAERAQDLARKAENVFEIS
jgi:hypothetical protein